MRFTRFALVLKKRPVRRHQGYYSLVMDAFILLDIEGGSNSEMRPSVSIVAVEITRSCRLTLKWHEIFA